MSGPRPDVSELAAKVGRLSTIDKLVMSVTLLEKGQPEIASQLARMAHEELELARLLRKAR